MALNKTEADNQMNALVDMYNEQEGLYGYVEFEPIVKTKPDMISIGHGSRIDSFVKLEGGMGLRIGRYVHIASFAHVGIGGGIVELSDYSAVASHVMIISGSNQIDAKSMSACAPMELQRVERSFVMLKEYAVALAGCIIFPGVTLHEGAVAAAGAVVTKDIPAWEIWAGSPAKFLRKREVR